MSIKEGLEAEGKNVAVLKAAKRVLSHPPTRRALGIGCLLMLFQQISGINTIMYYSATVVQMAGIGSASSAIWITAVINGLYLAACGIGLATVERLGRRLLLLFSLAGVIVSLLIIGAGFQLADNRSPAVHSNTNGSSKAALAISLEAKMAVCGPVDSCSACLRLQEKNPAQHCGFCEEPGLLSPGLCLSFDPDAPSHSSEGLCGEKGNSSYTWFTDYCPSPAPISWTIIVGLALYLISFAAGIAPIPWTVNSEIYPMWARTLCTSISTATNWTFNLLVAMTFLFLTQWLTRCGAFYLYAGLALLGWAVFFLLLPETQGRSLEQMEALFSGPLLVLFRKNHETVKE